MRFKLVVLAMALAALAFAMTPPERVNVLKSCDSLTITPPGKDPTIVFGKSRVRPLANMIDINSSAVRNGTGGPVLYKLSFFRGENKLPTDMLWVRAGGIWGFQDLRGAFGKNPKIIAWIEKAIKG